jgi:hypothetical protein
MNPIAIILLVLLILLLCNKSSMFSSNGGTVVSPCPPGYVVARCIGPGGSRVCTPHPADGRPTIYV